MPAISQKTAIVGPTPVEKMSRQMIDDLLTALQAVGYTIIVRSNADNTSTGGDTRDVMVRFPRIDQHDSYSDFFVLTNRNTSGVLGGVVYCYGVVDWDAKAGYPASLTNGLTVSIGRWNPAASFPTSGTPATIAGPSGSGSNQKFSMTFSGAEPQYDLRIKADEYGFVGTVLDLSDAGKLFGLTRPMDYVRGGRDIHVDGVPLAGYGNTLVVDPAPNPHLSFLREGRKFDITFPRGSSLTIYDLEREITLQAYNAIEAVEEDVAPAGSPDILRVRIPLNSPPMADVTRQLGANDRPCLQCFYQSPAWRAEAQVQFDVWNSLDVGAGGLTIVNGAAGTIVLAGRTSGDSWVRDVGARVGGVVYNHTQSQFSFISGFSTSLTPYDTINLDLTGYTWLITDDIEVLKGPYEHSDSLGGHAGLWPAVLSGNEDSTITWGASRELVLTDIYGEAEGKYEVGQTVWVISNGAVVTIEVGSSVGYLIGEEVVLTTGTSAGTRGRIRGVDGNYLVVDTTGGASGAATPYKVMPWSGLGTLIGQTSGTSQVVVSVTTTVAARGWMQPVPVTGITQPGAASGDLRHHLVLNFAHPNVNPAAVFHPGSLVGIRAKVVAGLNLAIPYNPSTGPLATDYKFTPSLLGDPDASDPKIQSLDPRRAEQNLFASTEENPHEPDHQTGLVEIAEFDIRVNSVYYARDLLTNYPNLRFVNARQNAYIIDIGDQLYEDQDPERPWVVVGAAGGGPTLSRYFGAGMDNFSSQYACIGTGKNLV